MKDNKGLRLEIHHAKTFDDICKENNLSTVEQALECKELWNVNNGFSIRYKSHKDIEAIRTKLRNMFSLENTLSSKVSGKVMFNGWHYLAVFVLVYL